MTIESANSHSSNSAQLAVGLLSYVATAVITLASICIFVLGLWMGNEVLLLLGGGLFSSTFLVDLSRIYRSARQKRSGEMPVTVTSYRACGIDWIRSIVVFSAMIGCAAHVKGITNGVTVAATIIWVSGVLSFASVGMVVSRAGLSAKWTFYGWRVN